MAIFLFEFQTSNEEEKEKAGEIFVFVGKDQKKNGCEKIQAHLSSPLLFSSAAWLFWQPANETLVSNWGGEEGSGEWGV